MPKVVPVSGERSGSIYRSGKNKSGSIYRRGPGRIVPVKGAKKHEGHHGVLGLAENLAKDVGEAIVGLPAGLKEIGVDPAVKLAHGDVRGALKEAKQPLAGIAETYRHTYSPLVHGHLREFGHRLYEHPLGPILDLATLVTLGEVGAVKFATLPAAAREVALRSPRALAREGLLPEGRALEAEQALKVRGVHEQPDVLERPLRGGGMARRRRELVHDLLNRLPADTPLAGEFARYGRELSRLKRKDALRIERKSLAYQRSYARMNRHERDAFDLLARYPLPRLLAKQIEDWKAGDEVARAFADVVSDKTTQHLYLQPTKKMLETIEYAREAGRTLADVLKIDPETVAERPWLHMRIASGARFRPVGLGKAFEGEPTPRAQEAMFGEDVGPVVAPGELGAGALVRPRDRGNVGRVVFHDPESGVTHVHFVNRRTGAEETRGFHANELQVIGPEDASRAEKVMQGGESIEDLRAELEREGRHEPLYLPDTATPEPVSAPSSRRSGGGAARPRRLGTTKQSHGVLAQLGNFAIGADTLSPAFMRGVKHALYTDIHGGLLAAAVRVPKAGARLRPGWEWIRQPVGRSSSETIPYTVRTRGEFLDELEQILPDPERPDALRDGFTTRDSADALEQDGFYLAIPAGLKREATGEFTQSGRLLNIMVKQPTKFWRAIVLNLRPAWLVNNIVGSHFLVALRYFGPRMMRAYAESIKEIGNDTAAFRQLVEKHFPEQAGGSFVETQLPSVPGGRALRIAGAGLAPADQAIEAALRRTAIRTELRRHPQVRARTKAMKGEAKAFERAAAHELEADPQMARAISDRVNDALGDFLALSPFEREYVRALFPFYAWYRAITSVALKLPLDEPLRASVLARLGQVGGSDTEAALGELPSYLRGAVPIGRRRGDTQKILTTSGLNPFGTVVQLGQGARALATGKPGELGRTVGTMANPYAQALVEQAVNRDLFTGGPARERVLPGPLGGTVAKVVEELPLLQLRRGPSPLYPQRDLRAQLLAYLGAPLKDVSVSEANRRASEEQRRR